MALTAKARDGSVFTDGATMGLVLSKGSDATLDYSEQEVEGVIRSFEHVDRELDDEGYAVGKKVTVCWEISTDDPAHPAIGFLPENVVTVR